MQSKFFLLTLLTIYLGLLSGARNCSDEPFDCGNITYIAYPFWGGRRTSECGRKGFEIVCNSNNTPIIGISSLYYVVHKLDFSAHTLTVARLDLHDTFCPNPLQNTALDWDLFHFPPDSTDRNLTLHFDCSSSSAIQTTSPYNVFTCANETSNLISIDDASSSFSDDVTCYANISVPVNNEDAQSLENPSASSMDILRSALDTGFSIQWFSDPLQTTSPYCNVNVYMSCGRLAAARPFVVCAKGSKCNYSAPVQLDGDAPVPSPAYSRRSGYGLPPAPSNGDHPQGRRNPQIHNGDKRAKKIIVGVALGVAGMIAVSISVHCFLKKRHSVSGPNPEFKHDVETVLLQQGSLAPKRYRYSEIKKITKSFSDKLGQGGYGSVYKGILPDGSLVAVKILIQTDSDGEEFINEVASISRTSHVNIVTLLGFCNEGNRRALVYEFMSNSSLDKFLNHKQSDCPLDLEKLYKIAVGIAKGLEYLHTGCNTRIVHFDIKPQNILLDEDLRPKISDFGLAKLYKKKQSILSMLGARGTAGYIAPEVFSRNFGGVSHKSDVYSYGMMLLEMAGGGKDEVIQSSENYFPDKIYEEVTSDVGNIVDSETGGEAETRKKMLVMGFWCIQTIPSSRPSISKVVEMLEGSLQSIQIPPKPFLFSPRREISSSLSSFAEVENSCQDEIQTSELASTYHV